MNEIPYLHGYEKIVTSVTSIEQAKTVIVDDARQKVVDLPFWSDPRLKTNTTQVGDFFDTVYPVFLRQAPSGFPLTLLREDNPQDFLWLSPIPEHLKVKIDDAGYWLAMTEESISAAQATYIRDYLWVNTPEAMLRLTSLPRLEKEMAIVWASRDMAGMKPLQRAMQNLFQGFPNK